MLSIVEVRRSAWYMVYAETSGVDAFVLWDLLFSVRGLII
jgi:hypothetical protein